MYLEDVTIQGFKSFSENTDMSFKSGISVIIGNNGVGKSNILDAIVWVLGENSLERIRCYDRRELFFAGSNGHPPAESIRVELNFKKEESDDTPAFQFAREMTRDGQSRYLFQNERIDRQAYEEQLKALRMRQTLKTIIRQEQINDILLVNPKERFHIIQSFLGLTSAPEDKTDFCQSLEEVVAPLFTRYMSYLSPLSEVRFDLNALNSENEFDLEITLPGNRVRRAHQLSGGEKAITSLALKLALFHQLQSPLYLLDEVEPALDYINHKSMQAFLKDVASDKQLIMITHLRSTIDLADTLHGVRTRFDGSSFMKFYFVMDERLLKLYKCC
ncbi:AAA family ATPase [Desulfococcaceae bacterium HSG9]|nr:AAA family ATPase [Desulfococcaceae bacterium HSG9]